VTFVQIKNKRRVLMPLHDTLEAWLLARSAPASGKAFVFPQLAGKGTGGAHGLIGRFMTVMKKAGIVADLARTKSAVKGSKGRDLSSLSFHSLRHTFNSMMANAGIAREVCQELTGHASAEMNNIYTHHEIERLRPAVEILPDVGLATK
jgi:integrase